MKKYKYAFKVSIFAQDDMLKKISKKMEKAFSESYQIGIGGSFGTIKITISEKLTTSQNKKLQFAIRKYFSKEFTEKQKKENPLEVKITVSSGKLVRNS